MQAGVKSGVSFAGNSQAGQEAGAEAEPWRDVPHWLASSGLLSLLFFFFFFLIVYLFHLHFQCYPKSPPHALPPTPLPTYSHFLALAFPCTEAYKVCTTNGPLFPLMADEVIFWFFCS